MSKYTKTLHCTRIYFDEIKGSGTIRKSFTTTKDMVSYHMGLLKGNPFVKNVFTESNAVATHKQVNV